MQQHQDLWINNAPPSPVDRETKPSTPIQQLHDRIDLCRQSPTYLGTDQLHVMDTMLHSQGITIVNYRFDPKFFDHLTLIHQLDYTAPHTRNALHTSMLQPHYGPPDIVVYNTQPGRHWEACHP